MGVNGYFRNKRVISNVLKAGLSGKLIGTIFPDKNTKFLGKVIDNLDARILDVGFGSGSKFLYPLYESWFRNVSGCDPFLEANIKYDNGLKIQKKELKDITESQDVICFNHSFEHINDPLATLMKTYELLPVGGYCIIRIPTCSSFAWEHYGVNWFQIDAPRHSFLHSVESIQLLADQANLKLKEIVFDSTHHQFTISERYIQNKKINEPVYTSLAGKIYHSMQRLSFVRKARNLNVGKNGDQAIFYLYKN